MSKLRVAVVYGGPSREYEISIRSGESILNHIDSDTYDVSKILTLEQGEWLIDDVSYNQSEALKQLKQRFDFCVTSSSWYIWRGRHGAGSFGRTQIAYKRFT
jgi:D-alanine-D-alanine ligase-like ATP-grasp enzyme